MLTTEAATLVILASFVIGMVIGSAAFLLWKSTRD